MKVVINEAQYNRLFNKSKTKLVITESQFNTLMVEAEMRKSLSGIEDGDLLQLTQGSENVYHFKIVKAIGDEQIYMETTDNGTLKGFYIFINSTSFQNHELKYSLKKIDEIEDLNQMGQEVGTWRTSTVKDIQKFEVFNPDQSPKFDIDVTTGAPKRAEEKPQDGENDNDNDGESVEGVDSVVEELNTMSDNIGETYQFTLNDGNTVNFEITNDEPKMVGMEMVDGSTGIYEDMINKTFEFNASNKNVNFRAPDDFDIQLTMYETEGEGDDSEIKNRSVVIKGIRDFESLGAIKRREEKERLEYEAAVKNFDYKELKEIMNGNQDLKDLIQTKPSAIFDLIGFQSLGTEPLSKILDKWGANVNKNGFPGDKFITGKIVKVKFTDKGKLIEGASQDIKNEFDSYVTNLGSMISSSIDSFRKGDINVQLTGWFVKDKYKYVIDMVRETGEDTYDILVNYKTRGDNKIYKLANYKVKIIDYNAKNVVK